MGALRKKTRDELAAIEAEGIEEFWADFLDRIAEGQNIRTFCAEKDWAIGPFARWIEFDDERRESYWRAKAVIAGLGLDEVLSIADSDETQYKLRVDTRIRLAEKMSPRFSNKVDKNPTISIGNNSLVQILSQMPRNDVIDVEPEKELIESRT